MPALDPHSYADSSQPFAKHIDLYLFLDFSSKTIEGRATFKLEHAFSGELFLDTRELFIESASDPAGRPLIFSLQQSHPIKGSMLTVVLGSSDGGHAQDSFSLAFRTSTHASALQWLEPSQTSGGNLPFVYTHCQFLHARSIFPCQDTPAARFKYSARVNIPQEMRAVMSAAHIKRLDHQDDDIHKDSQKDRLQDREIAPGRAIEVFEMEQPIPPYLFALAAGDIVSAELGPRSRVFAEPGVVRSAAYEFVNTEEMIRQAEELFGEYDWSRFDLLVLPPSFPYGGMENPRMVFLTPTVIVGDRSGVQVVAHELAHSWTGNLITNANFNDFWLNEGFTTYAERRIVEILDGEERVALHYGLGWNGLEEEMERFKDRPEFTKLKPNTENVDPDEVYSQVPYEKGCFFLKHLESELGRAVFDEFLKSYIHKFRFHSIDTETFLRYLKDYFPGIERRVDLHTWVYEPGMPPINIKPKSRILDRVLNFVDRFRTQQQQQFDSGDRNCFESDEWRSYIRELKQEVYSWQAQEWQVYLESLPKKVCRAAVEDLQAAFGLSKSPNWDIRAAFLVLAAYSGVPCCYPDIEQALLTVGRMRYLRPIYTGLLEGNGGDVARQLARRTFETARPKYHPIACSVVEGLMKHSNVLE